MRLFRAGLTALLCYCCVIIFFIKTISVIADRLCALSSRVKVSLAMCLQESDVYYIPTSGLSGQNLTTRSTEAALTAWYKGPCLLEQIGVYVHVA